MSNPLQHGFPPPPPVGGTAGPMVLYRRLIRRGDLCFDIGAHVGSHTAVMLQLGARVVAVEPQHEQAIHIPGAATVVEAAVGEREGSAQLHVCAANSYMSTLDVDGQYRQRVQQHWPAGYHYTETRAVPMVTLDRLISEHGLPAFAKIDVEGAEEAVLAGLSQPLPLLSFEVHDFDRAKADGCCVRLLELGDYRFEYAAGESFVLQDWPCPLGMFGDIYAFLQS